ncbi:MAG: radical SAM protein [Ferruginibacter sp.]|nr:radical SAM protein [Ferruginibacter sp.]
MNTSVFLFTPPFTQLNTPYPATAYLKGFLNTKSISSFQADLGIEVILKLFCKEGLTSLFSSINANEEYSANIKRLLTLQNDYINTIDKVISFLQGKNAELANLIAKRNYLPEANRFAQLDDLNWAFGSMGVQDRAKHIATLYLEDISDVIKECVDEHFGFSRYAEKLARSANSFDELYTELNKGNSYIDEILLQLINEKINAVQPKLVCISVPFPGNLYAALKCGKFIKTNFPTTKVCLGGGFANTELRSLSEKRIFEFVDYITLDDGEAPIENLLLFIEQKSTVQELKRTFLLQNNEVVFVNNANCKDYRQGQVGTPDYSDFYLDKYINAIEVVNPMHSLWSDGRWNKLTMAHGCYWGKCTFCDISLPYIKDYEPNTAATLCDRMEEMIAQTGCSGFHFVDEAAPPALMKALSIEIIKRKLVVSWWANIRFEKSFTKDLCLLLKAAGCIAVSGGLEVASDRLLKLIDKGITVEQVASVNKHFTEAGIMVHAYLMYGFPTQTPQETIDSLEMVRQMFEIGILQSAFWHLFTMTAHSPVGLNPEKYKVKKVTNAIGTFANNDIEHIDEATEHEAFGEGLKKSLFNYMHNIGFDTPLHRWFDFKTPKTTIDTNYIANILSNPNYNATNSNTKVIWLGNKPTIEVITKSKKGNQWQECVLTFETKKETFTIKTNEKEGLWLANILLHLSIYNNKHLTLQQVKENYEAAGLNDFELFWDNKPVNTLYKAGLLHI